MKAIEKWLAGYVRSIIRRPGKMPGCRHLVFCIVDHFEPFRGGADKGAALGHVRRWVDAFPELCKKTLDRHGIAPRHTFFYPEEEYDPDCMDILAGLVSAGLAEIEVHLHHRNDTADGFGDKLVRFRDVLRSRHGLLGGDAAGAARFGFIHGNWSLCNSRPDGDWCGVNEELGILAAAGCYADFTFPSAPSPTQPRTVNSIYRASDTPGRPRGHDRGIRVAAGRGVAASGSRAGRSLMLIQGPLGLNWTRRKLGLLPTLENAEISGGRPPAADRIPLWLRQHICVAGRPEWVFVKIHTHGALPANTDILLGDSMSRFHDQLCAGWNDGLSWRLHYVTAREMYNIIRAAEDGRAGDPGLFRDHEISPPPLA